MPRPRTAAHTLCEPAQSKCASTCHKSNFVRNLREKCHGPAGAPWSSTSLYNYRKNASVWKHCLGKKHILVGWNHFDWVSLLVAGRAPPVSDRATFVDYHRKSMRLVKTCQAMLNNQCLLVQDIHVQFISKMNMYTINTINTIYTNAHCDCTIFICTS
jgi:hypothetical protein